MTLTEQQKRLVEVNRQVAMHRRSLRSGGNEMQDESPHRAPLTESQLQTVAANRAEALRRAAEKRTLQGSEIEHHTAARDGEGGLTTGESTPAEVEVAQAEVETPIQ